MMPQPIFTIGHSNHPLDKFLELLGHHDISAVADVRSHPYSRYNPQFNREALKAALQGSKIAYVFLGSELGARSEDPNCCENGQVRYDRLSETPIFRKGLDRLVRGASDHRIAMMCAEKDPLTCHRALLVSRSLEAKGVPILHILEDGSLESHQEAIERLMKELGFPEVDLFRSRAEMIADAYEERGHQIAFRPETVLEDYAGRQDR